MGEVDVLAVEAVEERASASRRSAFQPMCGTVRRLETRDGAGEQAEPLAALVALLEEELHADADAEQGPAVAGPLAQRLVDAGSREPGSGARGVPDAGDDGERRLADLGRVGRDDGSAPARASAAQRLRRFPAP